MPGVKAASFSAGASPMQGEDGLFFWLNGQPKPAGVIVNLALVQVVLQKFSVYTIY